MLRECSCWENDSEHEPWGQRGNQRERLQLNAFQVRVAEDKVNLNLSLGKAFTGESTKSQSAWAVNTDPYSSDYVILLAVHSNMSFFFFRSSSENEFVTQINCLVQSQSTGTHINTQAHRDAKGKGRTLEVKWTWVQSARFHLWLTAPAPFKASSEWTSWCGVAETGCCNSQRKILSVSEFKRISLHSNNASICFQLAMKTGVTLNSQFFCLLLWSAGMTPSWLIE